MVVVVVVVVVVVGVVAVSCFMLETNSVLLVCAAKVFFWLNQKLNILVFFCFLFLRAQS